MSSEYGGHSLPSTVARMPERRFTFVRHASTVYNDCHLLNGDPRVPVAARRRGSCRRRRARRAPSALSLRSRAAHALRAHARDTHADARPAGTTCRSRSEPAFDDIDVGIFEGRDVKAYRAWRAEHGPAEAVPGGESRLRRARALRRRLRARARASRRALRPARRARRADPVPAQRAARGRSARGPGAHRREPRAPERGRGATRGRAGRDAAQAVWPSAGLTGGVSDRSVRSGRRAPGARCRSPRPPRPADDDRSRCTTSDACYEYAVNCNKLSICSAMQTPRKG